MKCTNPIDAGVLADYWLGYLDAAEEEQVETHLFACDECGTRLQEVIAIAEGVRQIAREGSLNMVVSETFLEQAKKNGLQVRRYYVEPGGGVHCTVSAEDDLLIGELAANLKNAKRVDIAVCDPTGAEQMRMSDILFNEAGSSVIWQYSAPYAKASPSGLIIARLLAVDESSEERLIGEYKFHHTRTIPGPAAW